MSMSKKSTTAPTPAASTEEEPHFDTATHLYSTVKNVWSWGRSLPVAGSVLGLYESAGAAILTKATSKDLSTIDSEILHHIGGMDKDVIDPAIAQILAVLWPGVEKAEDIVKTFGPKIPFFLYLFPMIKESTEEKDMPETSQPAALAVN